MTGVKAGGGEGGGVQCVQQTMYFAFTCRVFVVSARSNTQTNLNERPERNMKLQPVVKVHELACKSFFGRVRSQACGKLSHQIRCHDCRFSGCVTNVSLDLCLDVGDSAAFVVTLVYYEKGIVIKSAGEGRGEYAKQRSERLSFSRVAHAASLFA